MWVIERIKQEPVAFQAVIQALLALLVGFKVVVLTQDQVGLIWGLTAALLAFFTRSAVTPIANPKNSEGQPLVPSAN
jgi:hypothetical protein